MSLPKIPASGRYSRKLKASILAAIDAGVVSEAKASRYYQISPDEISEWRAALGGGEEHAAHGGIITETWSLNRKGQRIPIRIFEHAP